MDNMMKDSQDGLTSARAQKGPVFVWYCPSRWLLAHYDSNAHIQTLSSHMCMADLRDDDENVLALVDIKHPTSDTSLQISKPPFECRLRIYHGPQLVYNHFLDDIPAALLATNSYGGIHLGGSMNHDASSGHSGVASSRTRQAAAAAETQHQRDKSILTLAINEDLYFYDKLKPWFKMFLEDDDCILDSLSKSEIDAWEQVRQNKVDSETMRELLEGLAKELGNQELTSHSLNFLSLDTQEARKYYLMAWRMKKLAGGADRRGEHIMSMDTICCLAARLKYTSRITTSGDFGQTREAGLFLEGARWTRILDIQRHGLIVGTEDRHLLVYELRMNRTRLECHYRLQATPDHILVERRSPGSFNVCSNLEELTYRILISCRDCRIYAINQTYLVDRKSSPCQVEELISLKSNVTSMSWTGGADECVDNQSITSSASVHSQDEPTFVIACMDRRLYCFGSNSGQCKWLLELESTITCLVCLPKLQIDSEKSSLVGVGSQANRIDFYVASNGRIVDSIYFNQADYPTAATFGRFGREDNCLCLVTRQGHLCILILKRTAKFAHGQCLSSAASYASDTLAICSRAILDHSAANGLNQNYHTETQNSPLRLDKPAELPTAFALSRSSSKSATDQMISSMMQLDHNCDQVAAKQLLDAHTSRTQLPMPAKSRNFVSQILLQSRENEAIALTFASQMSRLHDKVKSMLQMRDVPSNSIPILSKHTEEGANRVIITQVCGLGNIYNVKLSIRLNLHQYIDKIRHYQESSNQEVHECNLVDKNSCWRLALLVIPTKCHNVPTDYRIEPFRRHLRMHEKRTDSTSIFETITEFKLYLTGKLPGLEPAPGEVVEVGLQVLATHRTQDKVVLIPRPLLSKSINVPLGP